MKEERERERENGEAWTMIVRKDIEVNERLSLIMKMSCLLSLHLIQVLV